MPRGGRRGGKPGKAYSNRTDLNTQKQPAMGNYAGPQLPYGQGEALMNSQRSMPVASPAPPAVPPGPGGPGGGPGGAAPAGPLPGALGDFARASERPAEPLTHGLPMGPGGGPEVLSTPTVSPAYSLLQRMAAQPFVSDEIRQLLNIVQR